MQNITNGMPTIKDVKMIKEQAELYLNDNPLQKEMFITSLESRVLMRTGDNIKESLKKVLFQNDFYLNTEIFNDNETNFFCVLY